MKIYTNEFGHMTNIAAMPIYGKNLNVGAGGVVWTFFLSSIISLSFSLSLGDGPI